MSLEARLKAILSGGKSAPAESPGARPAPGQVAQVQEGLADPNNRAAKSPEQNFAEIWGTSPAARPGAEKLFNTNPEEFSKVVSGMDFTKAVPQELAQKALGGDQEALMQLINRVGQGAFSTATISARDMVEHANKQNAEKLSSTVQEQVRAMLAQQSSVKRNASFSDPLVSPLLEEMSARLRAKFPEASAEDIAEKAEQHLMGLAQKIVSGSPDAVANRKQEQTQEASDLPNWESWAESGDISAPPTSETVSPQ